MKVHLLFKTPDVIENAIAEMLAEGNFHCEDDLDAAVDAVRKACEKWVKDGEYIEVEVDTDKGTCDVVI